MARILIQSFTLSHVCSGLADEESNIYFLAVSRMSLLCYFSNYLEFQEHKTQEVTVDDIISMMVEALENDEDIVQSDKSLYASPYGRQQYANAMPVMKNYVDPNLIIKKLISPFGLPGKKILIFKAHFISNSHQDENSI